MDVFDFTRISISASQRLLKNESEQETAVAAFEEYRKTVKGTSHQSDVWFSQLTDLVGKYIGIESRQYKTLIDKTYLESFYTLTSVEDGRSVYRFEPTKMNATIDMFINYIKHNGVYQKPQENFLSKMKQEVAVAWVFGLISVLGGGGFAIGSLVTSNKLDLEKYELKRKLDSLSRTPLAPIVELPDSNAKNDNKIGVEPKED
ncbi:hypothetical protein [Runella sp.]|uniref:hypothetical protein n=1 Tax=Runella sp. TaxID=1960881 RepID=UPI003D0BCA30